MELVKKDVNLAEILRISTDPEVQGLLGISDPASAYMYTQASANVHCLPRAHYGSQKFTHVPLRSIVLKAFLGLPPCASGTGGGDISKRLSFAGPQLVGLHTKVMGLLLKGLPSRPPRPRDLLRPYYSRRLDCYVGRV